MSLLFAAVLGCAAIASWLMAAEAKVYARRNLRFACLLYAALSVAGIIASSDTSDRAQLVLIVGLLISAMGPPLLAFAAYATLRRPPSSTLAAGALFLTCVTGVATVMTGFAVLVLAPQVAAIMALFVVAVRSPRSMAWRLGLSALALLAGSLSVVADSREAGLMFMLFSAAGLLGVSRALARA